PRRARERRPAATSAAATTTPSSSAATAPPAATAAGGPLARPAGDRRAGGERAGQDPTCALLAGPRAARPLEACRPRPRTETAGRIAPGAGRRGQAAPRA